MTTWEAVEPLTDESQDRAFWEPWTPKIGNRVRLVPNGECPEHTAVSESLRGQLGTVVEIDSQANHHDYRVCIDRPEIFPSRWMADFGPWCTASELEPLA